ncbi:hypothetical protein O181_031862 [Austropuccinia psidii MF-1]|uniref:Ubiquinone biosynthesis O-methyltransferase, mitochondrial n=1 Tax=Austropuccinia psidii MF-1 TaxID=1389203 RepID=A0A9Q3H5R8_9BASI|nr:hypothetical protein [Austropuccinia psidii MF-1]
MSNINKFFKKKLFIPYQQRYQFHYQYQINENEILKRRNFSVKLNELNNIPNQTNPTTTISNSEINHFNQLSSIWWNETGPFSLLHRMNSVRVEFLRQRFLNDLFPKNFSNQSLSSLNSQNYRFLNSKKVLDVGCGGGIFSEALARLGGNVLGVDAAQSCIEVAKQHAKVDHHLNPQHPKFDKSSKLNGQIDYLQSSIESLLQQEDNPHRNSYDLVCAMEVLEHVNDPLIFLKSLADLTKPGGHIVLSTISRTSLSRFLTITLAESNLPFIGIVPPGTHTYEKYIKPSELVHLFRDQLGWAQSYERSELEVRGCIYDPLGAKWRLFPRDAFWGEWCNYFFGVKKPL